ncbi:zinc finger protein 407-like [Branchiostoma floridae]|uniref:Zinc finger protein 407-like n=1 Tax=Branchiostoma floridae TaxID=7739 RepID=A0A9J7LCD1_BRAFL|nr:zinc finger protein 407-like [Branchiostoma floridae]
MEMHLTSALSGNSFDDLIEVLCLYKCRLCHFAVSTGKADVIVHIKTEHQQMMLGHGPVNCFPAMNSFTRQPGNSGVSTLSEALRSRHLMLQKDGLQGTSAVSIGNDLPVRWTVPPVQLSQERPREAVSYVTPSFEHFSQASGPAAAQRIQQPSSVASSGRFARRGLSSSTSLGNNVGGDSGMTVKEEPMSEGEEDAERLDPTWGDSEGSTRIADDEGAKGTGQSSSGVKLKKTVSIVCPICNARLYRKTVDRHMDLHNDRGGFSCDGCDFETDQWHEMRSHMQRKHKPKQRCQNCDFETWSTEVFAEHMEVCVAEEEGDGSKGRRKSSSTRRESDSSMRASHSQDIDKDEKSQEGILEDEETAADEEFEICAECGEQLQGQDVTIHKTLHNREGGFSCDKCEFKTESWPEIKDHLQENHKLKCSSCKYETLSESFLDKHVCKGAQTAMATDPEATADQVKGGANENNITEKEPDIDQNVEGETVDNTEDTETCSVCNVEIKSHSLQRHKELHDSEGGFKCNQCDFSSATWEDIESHLASKHDSAYRCANCEFETSSKATLEEHFKSGSCTFSDRESEGDGRVLEEGEEAVDVSMEDDETQDLEADDFEKYKDKLTSSGHCCVCGVRLYRKSVQRHMQLHNDEGGFSCPRCDFTTDTWKEILKHVDWHERVRKKYTCPNCPYSSWAKTKMQVHLKRCHSGGNTKESLTHLVCPLCGVKLQSSALISHMDSEHVLSTDKAIASPGKGEDKEASPFVQCPLCQIKVHRRMLRKHLDMPHVQWPKGAFAAPVSANPGTQGGSNVASAVEIECPLCSKKIPSDSLRKHLDEPHPQWSQNPSNVSLQVNQGLMTIMPEKKDLQVQCPLCGMCMHRNMLTKHMKMPHVRWPQGTVSCTAEDSKGENSTRETTLQGEGTVNNGLSSHGTASDQHDEVMVLSDDELEMDSDVFEEDDQQGSVGHCGICGEQVSDKSVERHMLLHDDKGGFSCDKCEFSTASWREMRTHIRNVHKEKLLCPECGFLATTIELLRGDVMNCREKTSAVCSICGQEVPGNQLQQHVKEAHSSVTNVMDIDLPSSLPTGKDDENVDVNQTVTQPGRGDSLIDSSPRMLPPKKRQSVAGAHDCPICGCHLYSKTVELHMRLHDAHGGFTCDLCNYITDEWRLMRTHYNSSHSGQRNWHAALKNDL